MQHTKKRVLILPAPQQIEVIEKQFENTEIVSGNFRDIEFRFNHKLVILHRGEDLRNFTFVWLSSQFDSRSMSRAISLYLDYHKVPHTDVNYGDGISKLVDLARFELNDLPMPYTFFQSKLKIREKIEFICKFCGFPLIAKDTRSSRGQNAFLIRSRSELIRVVQNLPKDKSFIFQEFIPNDFDWGILVARGKVVSAEKSYRTEYEFRNNACWGAKEVFENPDNVDLQVKQIAQKACKILKLEWGRADIIVNKYTHKPYLLEVNRFPGMTVGSTEETAFADYLSEKLVYHNLY